MTITLGLRRFLLRWVTLGDRIGRVPTFREFGAEYGCWTGNVAYHLQRALFLGLVNYEQGKSKCVTLTSLGWAALPVMLPCRRCGTSVEHEPVAPTFGVLPTRVYRPLHHPPCRASTARSD